MPDGPRVPKLRLILDFGPPGKYFVRVMIRSLRPQPDTLAEAHRESAPATLDGLAHPRGPRTAKVEGIDAPPALRRRLLEIGFTEGCPVRFVMATPFGDPLVFSLRGASIALRKSEARCVRVRHG
jgi:ferrous iron transport protein A